MMVMGFDDGNRRPKAEVMQKLEELVSYAGYDIESELESRPFTIGPVVKMGLMRFKTVAGKSKLKEWLGKNQHRIRSMGIWVGDNLGKSVRLKKTVTGKVKRALCEVKENRDDVTNDWRRGQVWVGTDLVAKWEDDKMLLLSREVIQVRERIVQLMKDAGIDDVDVCAAP